MIAIFKHELRTCFRSLSTYLFCAFLLVFVGIGAMLYNLQSAIANFEYVLQFVCIVLTVIIPVLTMRVISEEKKQKTDQLLYSLPITPARIILGKYFALLTVFLLPMCIIALYPLIFARFGDVYLPTAYGSMLAFFMMSAALIAIGTFISSLTENQGFAAGIAIPLLLLNYYSVTLAEYVSATAFGALVCVAILLMLLAWILAHLTGSENAGYAFGGCTLVAACALYWFNNSVFEDLLPKVMKNLSLFERFYDFVNGIFDITSLVFYITVIIFFLFLSVQSLEKRRYN